MVWTTPDESCKKTNLGILAEESFLNFVETAESTSPPSSALVGMIGAAKRKNLKNSRMFAHTLTTFLLDKLLDGVALFSSSITDFLVQLVKVRIPSLYFNMNTSFASQR